MGQDKMPRLNNALILDNVLDRETLEKLHYKTFNYKILLSKGVLDNGATCKS